MKVYLRPTQAGTHIQDQAIRAVQGGFEYFVFNETLYRVNLNVVKAELYSPELQDYIEAAHPAITSIELNQDTLIKREK